MKVQLIGSLEEGEEKYPNIYPFNEERDDYDTRHYLVIEWGDGEIQVESDHGQPEDNCIYRDWNWIASALEKAFMEGKRSGK